MVRVLTLVSAYREKFSRFGIKEKIKQEFILNYSEEDNDQTTSSWTWPPYSRGEKDRFYYRSVSFRTIQGEYMYQHSIKLGGLTEEHYAITTGHNDSQFSRDDAYAFCFDHVISHLIRNDTNWVTGPDGYLLF